MNTVLRPRVVGWLALCGIFLSHSAAAKDPSGAAIGNLRHQLDVSFSERQFEAYVEHCLDEMIMSGPVWNTKSRTELKDAFTRLTGHRPDVKWAHDVDQVRVFEDVAFETGRWREDWTQPDGPTHMGGLYSALWKKRGTEWVLKAEVFAPMECHGSPYCD